MSDLDLPWTRFACVLYGYWTCWTYHTYGLLAVIVFILVVSMVLTVIGRYERERLRNRILTGEVEI